MAKYFIVDEKGKVYDTFRNLRLAMTFLPKLEKQFYIKLKIVKLKDEQQGIERL